MASIDGMIGRLSTTPSGHCRTTKCSALHCRSIMPYVCLAWVWVITTKCRLLNKRRFGMWRRREISSEYEILSELEPGCENTFEVISELRPWIVCRKLPSAAAQNRQYVTRSRENLSLSLSIAVPSACIYIYLLTCLF